MIRRILLLWVLLNALAVPALAQPAPERPARPAARPPAKKRPKATRPRPATRRVARDRDDDEDEEDEREVGSGDPDDPFRPPSRKRGLVGAGPEVSRKRHRPWFVRPELTLAIRFSPDRTFLPYEGFGFSMQAGYELGQGVLRLAFAVGYQFQRIARAMDIEVGSPELTTCSETRSMSHHLAGATIMGTAHLGRRVRLWAGFGGGYAFGELTTPNETCADDEAKTHDGYIMPELGLAYALKRELWIGLNVRYIHFFDTKTQYQSATGFTHRLMYDLLTVGLAIHLLF